MEDYDEQYKCRGCLTKEQSQTLTDLGYSSDEILLMQLSFSEREITRLEDGTILIPTNLKQYEKENI